MPVRRFDGIDDTIRCAVGGADVYGAWTMAILLRPTLLAYRVVYQAHGTDGRAIGYGFEIDDLGRLRVWQGAGNQERVSPNGYVARDTWRLVAISKGSGNVQPRFHSYDFSTTRWSREYGLAMDNAGSAAGGQARFGQWRDDYFFEGDVAAAVMWSSALADATIDTLATAPTLTAWSRVGSPVALWLFNQGATGRPLLDVIGAADEAVTPPGTTVVFDEPPIPFTSANAFHYGGAAWARCPIHVYDGAAWVQATGLGVAS
jgi:hypothetical protein